jgi:putative transposase
MWTEEHRETYRRAGGRFPSDLTDAEWARLEPLIPAATPGGRPRKTDMRSAMNAILYLLRTGCPWRYLPGDGFPPRSTVYNIFRKFQRDGVWDAIWAEIINRKRPLTLPMIRALAPLLELPADVRIKECRTASAA